MTGVHVLGVELRPLLSLSAALLGALIVALSLLLGDSDSTSTQPVLAAPLPVAGSVPCPPDEVCRQVVRLGGDGSAPDGGVAGAHIAVIRISPESQKVNADEQVVIEIRIDNVPERELGAYDFEIQYEPRVLTFESVADGGFLDNDDLRSILCPPIQLDETLGTIRFACNTPVAAPPDGPPGPTGSGLLATVRFDTACSGFSILRLTDNTTISDPGSFAPPMEFTTVDGDATVNGGAACPTPTMTASPTPTSTTTSVGTPISGTPTVSPTLTVTPTGTLVPPATATLTPATALPTATWTQVPTWTPAPTWTPEPTWTPNTGPTATDTPRPTNTPTSTPVSVPGDTSCDGAIGPSDATLILQLGAGIIVALPCPGGGDADGNGITDIVDASVILQFSMGIIASLPPP